MFVPLYSGEATVAYGHRRKTLTVKLFRLLDASGQFIVSLEAITIDFNCSFLNFLLRTRNVLINLILNMSGAAANLADNQN